MEDWEVKEKLDELSYYTGTTAYHKLAANAVLTDGTLAAAVAFACFWLFQATAAYMIGHERVDDFAVIKIEADSEHRFRVMMGDGNDHYVKLFEGGFTSFPRSAMPYTLFAGWNYEIEKWVFMLTSEY